MLVFSLRENAFLLETLLHRMVYFDMAPTSHLEVGSWGVIINFRLEAELNPFIRIGAKIIMFRGWICMWM